MVSFVNTPAGTRNPGFYFEINAALANTGATPKRALLVGPVQSGSTASGVPELCQTLAQAQATYGVGSVLTGMVEAYKARDIYGELWVLPTAVPSGTAASLAQTFLTAATAAGTLSLYVCDRLVQVAIAAGDTVSGIAIKVAAAVNADPTLPVSVPATPTTGLVTYVAKTAGLLDFDVRYNVQGVLGGEAFPAGVTVGSVTTTAGTGTPSLAAALSSVGDTKYDLIACAWADTTSLDALKTWLSDATGRWAPTRKLFGHALVAVRATLGQATTLLTARNDQHVSILPVSNSPSPAWRIAADTLGSIANPIRNDPSLPVQKIAVGWRAPPIADRFAFSERDVLLHEGGSTFEVDRDNTVRVSRLVTTYQTNSFGVPDDSFLDFETPFQLAEVIEFYESDFSSSFARKRLVANGTRFGAGDPDSITPQILQVHALALYRELERRGRVQDSATFKQLCFAEIVGEGRVNLLLPITLANQLRVVASLVQFKKP